MEPVASDVTVSNGVSPPKDECPKQTIVPDSELPKSNDRASGKTEGPALSVEKPEAPETSGIAEPQTTPDIGSSAYSADSVAAFDYADYPEVSATQPASQPQRRPSVSASEPPAVPVASADERIIDNVPVQRVVAETPDEVSVKSPPVEFESTEVSATVQRLPESPVVGDVLLGVPDGPVKTDDQPEVLEDDGLTNEWHDILPQLKLSGMAQQLAEHCLFKSQADGKVILTLDTSGETLKTTRIEEALQEALSQYYSQPQQLTFEDAVVIGETPEKRRIRVNKERQVQAELAIAEDPVILELQQRWGAVLLPGSVKPNKDVEAF